MNAKVLIVVERDLSHAAKSIDDVQIRGGAMLPRLLEEALSSAASHLGAARFILNSQLSRSDWEAEGDAKANAVKKDAAPDGEGAGCICPPGSN